jgi:hypothetical protein
MHSHRLRFIARCAAIGLAAFLAVPGLSPAADVPAQSTWQGVDKVVAFADVHGSYADLVSLLQAAQVIDDKLRWSAGRTHAVSLGDLLDRGAESRKVMDLLMRLQDEAAAAGGALHVVLGNHEAMNLLGDLRYVANGEYAVFAQEEPAGVREQRRTDWIAQNGAESGPAFDQKFPPGYFGHRAAFAPGGKYGRWLLSLPVVIAVNDGLYMHAGPSKVVRGMGIAEINTRYRSALVEYLTALDDARSAGLVREGDAYAQRPDLAAQRLTALAVQDGAQQARLAAAVQRLRAADDNPMLGVDGPNWYRGPALCNECTETDSLLPILDALGLRRLVVGHTPTRDGRVVTRFDGRVVKLDAGMNRSVYRGHPAALLLAGGQANVIYADGDGKPVTIPAEGLTVAPYDVDDATVADVLASGTVTAGAPRVPGVIDVAVEKNGVKVPAVFVAAEKADVNRELAAYRLDRTVQLGIVPATVAREVDGQRGYLQARPVKWVTETDAQKQSLRKGGWCPLDAQFELVYAFDALVGNEGRGTDNLLYDSQEWRVLVTAHARAFGTSAAFPAYLKQRPAKPGAELRRRLAALNDAALTEAFGDLLSARARKAVLERRDLLLAAPAAAAAAR